MASRTIRFIGSYMYRHPKKGPHFEQKGLRENLLCAECEEHLCRYEDYASRTVFGARALARTESADFLVLHGVDYTLFKLFQLSLIWRAGESSLETFASVSLGPHATALRRMLLAGDPGATGCYPCLLMFSPAIPGALARAIPPPDRIRSLGYWCYRFIIGGVIYCCFVTTSTKRLASDQIFLSRAGDLPILLDNDGSAAALFAAKLRGLVELKRAHSRARN